MMNNLDVFLVLEYAEVWGIDTFYTLFRYSGLQGDANPVLLYASLQGGAGMSSIMCSLVANPIDFIASLP